MKNRKAETDKTVANEEWAKRIKPLIAEVNRDCKKKWFTRRRKFQLVSISVPVAVIMIIIALLPVFNSSVIVNSAEVLAQLSPENATVIIGNETVPLKK